MNDLPDEVFLLNIFRKEAEDQLKLFEQAIIKLEQNPCDPNQLEVLMRAAHSMKGAAQIVGLKPVSDLSHILEDIIVDYQKAGEPIPQKPLNDLLSAFESLASVSSLPDEAMRAWPGERLNEVQDIERKIKKAQLHKKAHIQSSDAINFQEDSTMQELFIKEIQNSIQSLKQISKKGVLIDDEAVRAGHSIKGASSIIGFEALVRLGDLLEHRMRALKGTCVTQSLLDRCLFPLLALLDEISKISFSEIGPLMECSKERLQTLELALEEAGINREAKKKSF